MKDIKCIKCNIKLEKDNAIFLSSNLIICSICSDSLDEELMKEELDIN